MKKFFTFFFCVVLFGSGCSSVQHQTLQQAPTTISTSTNPASTTASVSATTSTTRANKYGMSEYVDTAYGFSFWYPNDLQVTSSTAPDDGSFPGGITVETLIVGAEEDAGPSIAVVNSPTKSITDEPADHASPISQTKYFYDVVSQKWMVAFPQGTDDGSSAATTTADVSSKTMGGLLMLPSGRRFDTTIIPLSTTRFLVISDGGGSSFTRQLAETVSLADTSVTDSVQGASLQAEAAAYAQQ